MSNSNQDILLETLFADADFTAFIAQSTLIEQELWETWFLKRNEFLTIQVIARKIYLVRFYEVKLKPYDVEQEEVWQVLHAKIDQELSKTGGIVRYISKRWIKYAAAALLLFFVSLTWITQREVLHVNNTMNYLTKADKESFFSLKDGSSLRLGKESQASYSEDAEGRKLTFQGKAYLEVKQQEKSGRRVPFIVNQGNFEIEVLGTSFYMIHNTHTKLVALDEGFVRISNGQQSVAMKAGEVVVEEGGMLKLLDISSQMIQAEQTGILQLKQTTLQQLASWLRYTQDKEVILKVPHGISQMTTSGTIDILNKSNLYETLSRLFNVKISERPHDIHIEYLFQN